MLREGYFGVVAGHDHRNGFVGEHEGLLLIATPTCGFNTYGPAPAKRATRLIEFDIRHPYEPRTQLLEFGELVGKPSSKRAYTYAVTQTTPTYTQQITVLFSAKKNGVQVPAITRKMFE